VTDQCREVFARGVGGVDHATDCRSRVERAEVVARHEQRPDLLDAAVGGERQRLPPLGGDCIEGARVLPELAEFGVGQLAVGIAGRGQHDPAEAIDVLEPERMKEQAVDRGEGDGIDADADGQREDRQRGEAGPARDVANGVAEVGQD
jgi:hypothetical protein